MDEEKFSIDNVELFEIRNTGKTRMKFFIVANANDPCPPNQGVILEPGESRIVKRTDLGNVTPMPGRHWHMRVTNLGNEQGSWYVNEIKNKTPGTGPIIPTGKEGLNKNN